MRWAAAVCAALAAVLVAGCGTGSAQTPPPSPSGLKVTEVASGLVHPWDIGFLPGGRILLSQRPGRLAVVSGGRVQTLRADLGDVYAQGEGGLMGLALLPGGREFVTCQTHAEGGRPVDVRLVRWHLAGDTAVRDGDLLTGLPINPSGRHSGCRPTVGPDGMLLVGTGDTATATVAQDKHSLGGKVLRIDPRTGAPPPDNPFATAADPRERYLRSYGHRNVQGVAIRPGTGQVFTAEHGPDFDDEINLDRPGGNYGWDPSKGGTDTTGYDESVPMTDLQRFPDAVRPLWTSGRITQAISGAAFVTGKQWGALNGTLAVVALKGQKLLLYTLSRDGRVTAVRLPTELNDAYGRLRGVRSGPDGALYVTTSNGDDDKLLRVTPG